MRVGYGAIVLCLLAACSVGLVTMDYKPSSLLDGRDKGDIRLGRFEYHPRSKMDIKENQIQDTLFLPIYLDQPVASYVRKAFALELKFAQFNTQNDQSVVLYADVRKLESDNISTNINWTLSIEYTLAYHGKSVYGRTVTTEVRGSKVNAPFESVNKLIRLSFDTIMTDPVVEKLMKYSPGDIRMLLEEQRPLM
jgi:hypothetical protein